MLALAAASHSQDPTLILTALAAVTAAVFWRFLLKVAIAVAVIAFAVLLILGIETVLHGLSLIVR
jgi:hypothetical protein